MKHLKYINILLAIIFVGFATVQWNDPDSWAWMAAYSGAALVSVIAFLEKMPKKILVALMAITAFAMFWRAPEVYATLIHYDANLEADANITHSSNTQTEEFKEFSGLAIILIALVFQYLTAPIVLKKPTKNDR